MAIDNIQTGIELVEYQPKRLPAGDMSQDVGLRLWRGYKGRLEVEFPGPKTGSEWQITSLGYVGHIPVSRDLSFHIYPRVAISNVFRMMETAYSLKGFNLLDGQYPSGSLEEFYRSVAELLARRVMDRGRKGFYKAYVDRNGELPYLSGRIETNQLVRRPWSVRPECSFQDHTPDVEVNQILTWTLFLIARTGLCSGHSAQIVRRAFRDVGFVTLRRFEAGDCIDRVYNRLNEDYEPLHLLCRFFLENTGPTHALGGKQMSAFLINMSGLFERFVAKWLGAHLPEGLALEAQETVKLSDEGNVKFAIDLVVSDKRTGEALAVLDTKYKDPSGPTAGDLQQAIAYAQIKRCREALLVYPATTPNTLYRADDITVRALSFSLEGDLEAAGVEFLRGLARALGRED